MQVGFVGLGTMGGAAVKMMVEAGHDVFGFDVDEGKRIAAETNGVKTVSRIGELSSYAIVLLSLPGYRGTSTTIPVCPCGLRLQSTLWWAVSWWYY